MEYININNGADFILIPPLNNILHYFSFYFRILRKIYIFATGYTMCFGRKGVMPYSCMYEA